MFRAMTPDANRRWGFLGGTAGAVLGGFLWIVVAGLVLRDPRIWASGAAIAVATWWAAAQFFVRYPGRGGAILGVIMLFVVLVDWIYLSLLLPRLPEQSSVSLGTSRASFQVVQPILLAGGLAGTGLVLWDLLRRR